MATEIHFDLMNGPIISSQELDSNDPIVQVSEEDNELFDFENIFDVLFDLNRNDMSRHGLTEESIFYYPCQKMKSLSRFMNTTKRII